MKIYHDSFITLAPGHTHVRLQCNRVTLSVMAPFIYCLRHTHRHALDEWHHNFYSANTCSNDIWLINICSKNICSDNMLVSFVRMAFVEATLVVTKYVLHHFWNYLGEKSNFSTNFQFHLSFWKRNWSRHCTGLVARVNPS